MSTHFPEELIIPKEVQDALSSSDPLENARGEKQKQILLMKYRRVGLQTAVCPVHGRRSILYFNVAKSGKKWYISSECNTCKAERERPRSKNRVLTREEGNKRMKDQIARGATWYLKKLIEASGVKKEDITEQMIKDKRAHLLKRRQSWKTDDRKEKKREDQRRATKNATDAYIRTLIRISKNYNGEEITPEMIETKRSLLLAMRKHSNHRTYLKKQLDSNELFPTIRTRH